MPSNPTPAPPGPLALIGGGGHACVVAEAALRAGFSLLGVYDDGDARTLNACLTIQRLGAVASSPASDAPLLLCVGDLALRAKILAFAQPAFGWATVIDPSATVSPSAELGEGTFLSAGAIVNAKARIGAHAILNTGAIVEHHCTVGDNTHLAPRAVLCGESAVGANTLIGAGAVVLPGVRVGANCIVGAGAVVARDVKDTTRVVGVPAR